MSYQYKREPSTPDEANRLANACKTHDEKLIVWTLLDTGLRVANRAHISRDVTPHVLHTFSVTAVQKGISLTLFTAYTWTRSLNNHRNLFKS